MTLESCRFLYLIFIYQSFPIIKTMVGQTHILMHFIVITYHHLFLTYFGKLILYIKVDFECKAQNYNVNQKYEVHRS